MPRLLRPRWLGAHLLAVVAVVVCVVLGRWQWGRAHDTHRLQNWSYAFEWWLFAVFSVFLWAKSVKDATEPVAAPRRATAPVMRGAAPMARPVTPDDDDPELAAYNAHLRALAARDTAGRESDR